MYGTMSPSHTISRLVLADLGEALSANRWITRVWQMQGQSFGPWPTLYYQAANVSDSMYLDFSDNISIRTQTLECAEWS